MTVDALDDIYEAFATATPWRRNDNPLSMRATIAVHSTPVSDYDVSLTVILPRTYLAWTDPRTLKRSTMLNFDLASEEAWASFNAAADRSNGELRLIFDRCNREWRAPTPDEELRIAELKRDFDLAEAALEMSVLPSAH